MSERPCRLRKLAERPGCRVDVCEHGHVHVNLGALTLRLAARELHQLAGALDDARACLASPAGQALH